MTAPRVLFQVVCALMAGAVVALHGQAERRGQASDEANRSKVDEVSAGQNGFVTIFDGTSMRG